MSVTFITPTPITVSGFTASTYTAVSAATSGLPAGATGILLNANNTDGNAITVSARMTGSTDAFNTGGMATKQLLIPMGVNGSQSFDFYTSAPAHTNLDVLGYFGPETTFFTNAFALTALTTSYATYNVSADCPGGVAAILSVDSAYAPSVRIGTGVGSTDDFENPSDATTRQYFIVGLDAAQTFQAKARTAGPIPHLHGYMTGGIVWNQNAISRTPSTFGSFQPLATESGAVGYLYQFGLPTTTGGTSSVYTVRTQGTSLSLNVSAIGGFNGQNAAGTPAEVNIAVSSAMGFYELAYFTAPIVSGPSFLLYHRKNVLYFI